MVYFQYLDTPLGTLRIGASETAVTELSFQPVGGEATPNEVTQEAALQLGAYFVGARRAFDLPLAPAGTAFQHRVWEALRQVPFGEAVTYGELAARVSCGSAQAVGQAVGRNPLLIVVPCHRVLAAGGREGGFSAGLWRKENLLKLENIPFRT
ncbi:MAG: methylated-DNA--[protein]-cysteine S-methyltransferase [Oscillospiraceae bacterium]|nr:methylated-DNA--[protein]-cysteine S-methyltransferase [Oscillospiraceae bacterium]